MSFNIKALKKLLAGRPLITGTMILTGTGLITRFIGFFYRIYLSHLFGEEGMGVYQLISPVLALSFSLCAAAYQTSISKFVAEYPTDSRGKSAGRFRPLIAGLALSTPLSLLCTFVLLRWSEPIATVLLQEARTEPMLRILAFSIPFSSIHSCINGYFYGIKKTAPAASAQLLEQISRVGCVWLITTLAVSHGREPSVNAAVLGLSFGELISMLVSLCVLYLEARKVRGSTAPLSLPRADAFSARSLCRRLLAMALPLTGNRIVLNLLASAESVSIPSMLQRSGLTNAEALSVYGVLTGMALPFVFFPNALTGSVSVLLLPLVSEQYAAGNLSAVRTSVRRTIAFCLTLGFGCMTVFLLIGRWAGSTFFGSTLAGHFIVTLSFLCPFLYLDSTLSSILQGLGKTGWIFAMNVLALLVRLGFVFLAIPVWGITGYLWGILVSQILYSVLCLVTLKKFLH